MSPKTDHRKNKQLSSSLTFKNNLRHYFSQYCSSTSMHGIRYVGEPKRFLVEKLTWTTILLVINCLCLFLIHQAYKKWMSSPVIITFSTTEMPIWKIPFPAITICPETKSDPAIFNYTDVLMKKLLKVDVKAEEEQYFNSFALICDVEHLDEYMDFDKVLNLTLTRWAMENLVEALPLLDPHNMSSAYWLNKAVKLEDMLSGIITNEGLCYSFNMVDYSELLVQTGDNETQRTVVESKPHRWSLENGYPDTEELETFPRRTFVSGTKGGVLMEFFTNHTHLDYFCKDALQGFKVTLHHPADLPNMDRHFQLPLDQAVLVGIKPKLITVAPELKSYPPDIRKCYFLNERRLQFFKHYSQKNCFDECLSNYTLSKCGCIAFYMPKFAWSPICGPGSKVCLERSKVEFLRTNTTAQNNNEKFSCNCLPTCTLLEYEVEISYNDWNWWKIFETLEQLNLTDRKNFDYEEARFSRLVVYYKEMQFLHAERHELYGPVDFFANVGGLLSLFVGFSVITAIEIVYYLSLRIVCNVKMYGKSVWSGQKASII